MSTVYKIFKIVAGEQILVKSLADLQSAISFQSDNPECFVEKWITVPVSGDDYDLSEITDLCCEV